MSATNIAPGKNDLILNVLKSVCGALDQYLTTTPDKSPPGVVLSNLFDHGGNPVAGTKNKVVMMVANISQETAVATYDPSRKVGGSSYATKAPPVYINLDLLFYANMAAGGYDNALTAISEVISFFQQYRYFTPETLPDLDPAIDKLSFEMRNLDLLDVNHVVGQFGAKYLPCVMYKLRLIPFDGPAVFGEVAAIEGITP